MTMSINIFEFYILIRQGGDDKAAGCRAREAVRQCAVARLRVL